MQSGHLRQSMDPKIAADLRPSADGGPQSAHLWRPAVAKLQAASVPIGWPQKAEPHTHDDHNSVKY